MTENVLKNPQIYTKHPPKIAIQLKFEMPLNLAKIHLNFIQNIPKIHQKSFNKSPKFTDNYIENE